MMDNVHVVLDMKGLSCPKPLIGAKRMVDELNPGQVLLLISNCPGTPDDLFSWAELTGNQVIKTEKMDNGTGYHIQKGGKSAKHPHAHVSLDIRGAVCPGPIVEAKKLLNGMQKNEVLKLISGALLLVGVVFGFTQEIGATVVVVQAAFCALLATMATRIALIRAISVAEGAAQLLPEHALPVASVQQLTDWLPTLETPYCICMLAMSLATVFQVVPLLTE